MIKPLGKRLAVKRIGGPVEKTAGGIYIPEQSQDLGQEAEVVAVGSQVKDLAVGNKVLISYYAGTEVRQGDAYYILLTEDDVLATLK